MMSISYFRLTGFANPAGQLAHSTIMAPKTSVGSVASVVKILVLHMMNLYSSKTENSSRKNHHADQAVHGKETEIDLRKILC